MPNNLLRVGIGAIATLIVAAGLYNADTAARPGAKFDDGSLRGDYAVVGNGGASEAASVGVTRFDGARGAERTLVLNEQDPNSSGRLILTVPATGSYTVSPDGVGSAVFLNELPDGSRVPFHFDFVITQADRQGSRLLARSLHMVQREPGIAAKLVVFDLTRLPN